MSSTAPEDIVSFWHEAGPKSWFAKSDAFDQEIATRFMSDIVAARNGERDAWIETAGPCLALLLLLDQFPRNVFRGTPEMFASDAHAVTVASRAIELGHDRETAGDLKAFIYMPFMHSEQLADQERCVALFTALGAEENLKFAIVHLEIIQKFGRFPHRNPILGRTSTPEEVAFLESGGFAG